MKSERNKLFIRIYSNQIFFEFSINLLHELIEQQTEQLKALNQKCLDLSSQIDSHAELQAEVDRQK